MCSQHREVITACFAAVDGADIAGLLLGYADDVVYERPGYPPIAGREALDHFYRVERTIAVGRHTIEGVLCDNGHGAAWGRFEGVSRTGDRLTERWCDTYVFERDLIVFRRTHFFRPGV